jgi:hypothetical protein
MLEVSMSDVTDLCYEVGGKYATSMAEDYVTDSNVSSRDAENLLNFIDNFGIEVPEVILSDFDRQQLSTEFGVDLTVEGNFDYFIAGYCDTFISDLIHILGKMMRDANGFLRHCIVMSECYPGVAFYVDADYGDELVTHMVGDDRVFILQHDEVTVVNDDEYCHTCGQIGCSVDVPLSVEG